MKVRSTIPDLSDVLGQDSDGRFEKELLRQSVEFEGDTEWLYAWYVSSAPNALKLFTTDMPKIPKNREYKVFGRLGDNHHQPMDMIKWLNSIEIDLLLSAYYDSRYWRYVKAKMIWVPWSYDPTFYYPSDKDPVYDVAFLGTVSEAYPVRMAIDKELSFLSDELGWRTLYKRWGSPPTSLSWYLIHKPSMVLGYLLRNGIRGSLSFVSRQIEKRLGGDQFTPAPWLEQISKLEKDPRYIVGREYAEVIRSTRVFIFGTSIYKHPIKRLFFGLGSGTCVLMDTPNCADKLGLMDGENYVSINKDNCIEKLKWILDDEEERSRIAKNGLRLAQERHTHDVRAKEVLRILQDESSHKRVDV